jgi:hypothetical protein
LPAAPDAVPAAPPAPDGPTPPTPPGPSPAVEPPVPVPPVGAPPVPVPAALPEPPSAPPDPFPAPDVAPPALLPPLEAPPVPPVAGAPPVALAVSAVSLHAGAKIGRKRRDAKIPRRLARFISVKTPVRPGTRPTLIEGRRVAQGRRENDNFPNSCRTPARPTFARKAISRTFLALLVNLGESSA